MAVNPEQGTGSLAEAAAAIEKTMFADEPEVETEAVEAEVEAEEVETEEAEPEETQEEQPTIETLEQVAEALGVSLDDMLTSLKHKVKVDGEESEVTLSELQSGYQKDRDYRQKTAALKREREEFDAQRAEITRQIQAEHAQNAYILNTLEQNLVNAMQSEEMARLAQTNRTEWLAKRLEFQDRVQALQKLKQEAANRYQALQQQAQQEQQNKIAQILEREKEALSTAIPDWNDGKRQSVNEYAVRSLGFKPEEVGQVIDHRFVVMAHKAMLYDQQQKQTRQTVKAVKAAPKLIKPTKPASAAQIAQRDVMRLKGRLKQSGKVEDFAKLLVQTGKI
jgi:transcriptional regulator with XRE-family HTH domain